MGHVVLGLSPDREARWEWSDGQRNTFFSWSWHKGWEGEIRIVSGMRAELPGSSVCIGVLSVEHSRQCNRRVS